MRSFIKKFHDLVLKEVYYWIEIKNKCIRERVVKPGLCLARAFWQEKFDRSVSLEKVAALLCIATHCGLAASSALHFSRDKHPVKFFLSERPVCLATISSKKFFLEKDRFKNFLTQSWIIHWNKTVVAIVKNFFVTTDKYTVELMCSCYQNSIGRICVNSSW